MKKAFDLCVSPLKSPPILFVFTLIGGIRGKTGSKKFCLSAQVQKWARKDIGHTSCMAYNLAINARKVSGDLGDTQGLERR